MNKLEQEMFFALYGFNSTSVPNEFKEELESVAKNAASVAGKYIKQAILDSFQNHTDAWNDPEKAMSAEDFYDHFLKEIGIPEW